MSEQNYNEVSEKKPANVLVIGAARSGLAASRLMRKQNENVTLTDQKKIDEKEELEEQGIRVFDEGHPQTLFEEDFDYVVKNPGIPYRAPLVAHFVSKGTPVYTEIETAYLAAPQYAYAAITGTDGKTTTVTLLHEMLREKNPKAKAAGNIGVPLSEIVLEEGNKPLDIALELSNFQLLGTKQFRPHVSAITNLAPDHLDYMNSLEDYYLSKFRILKNQRAEDYFILNTDDPVIMEYFSQFEEAPVSVIRFSLRDPEADLSVSPQSGDVTLFDTVLFNRNDLKLVGDFNLGNAMMAAASAYLMGVTPEQIQNVIQTFPGVEHRIEYVTEKDGVRYYNDSKATNTHSAEAALSSFDGSLRLLCGGKNKGIDYSVLKKYDDRIAHCYSFGQIRDLFSDIFSHQSSHETMEDALDAAMADAKSGDVILLCPATSSFDQFKNYEVRGEIFKDLVRKKTGLQGKENLNND